MTVDADHRVIRVEVLSAAGETPAVGGRCLRREWLDQFAGKDARGLPETKYDFSDCGIDAISGATRTSMAIVACVRTALAASESKERKQ